MITFEEYKEYCKKHSEDWWDVCCWSCKESFPITNNRISIVFFAPPEAKYNMAARSVLSQYREFYFHPNCFKHFDISLLNPDLTVPEEQVKYWEEYLEEKEIEKKKREAKGLLSQFLDLFK